MSCLHLEGLVKRISRRSRLPLGRALQTGRAKAAIDAPTWEFIRRLTPIGNRSKHEFSQDIDTHMFDWEDAVLVYFIARRLARGLYPLAQLKTDVSVFLEYRLGDSS